MGFRRRRCLCRSVRVVGGERSLARVHAVRASEGGERERERGIARTVTRVHGVVVELSLPLGVLAPSTI